MVASATVVALDAAAQRFHQIDHLAAVLSRLRPLDLLAGSLALDQPAQCQLVLVPEGLRVEMARLGVEDMLGERKLSLLTRRLGACLKYGFSSRTS